MINKYLTYLLFHLTILQLLPKVNCPIYSKAMQSYSYSIKQQYLYPAIFVRFFTYSYQIK